MHALTTLARFGGVVASGLQDVTHDPEALDSSGFWAVVADFEGRLTCARFGDVRSQPVPAPVPGRWRGPGRGDWTSSLDRVAYTDSPELFLRGDGVTVESGPVKGTGPTEADLLEKDRAENVMIVDLVRNDLGRVCATGSVTVPALCAVEPHPGLVHLVSTVLETAPRGPYCGAIGWVDADRGRSELAVGIRTFWIDRGTERTPVLRFGAGAGITWGSDPEREWEETELKAGRLLAIASNREAVTDTDTDTDTYARESVCVAASGRTAS